MLQGNYGKKGRRDFSDSTNAAKLTSIKGLVTAI
jgi:hypothetical protein